MSDGAKPSFKHALAKKALAPVVTSVATAITAFLMRKAAELWQQKLQPKVEEKGGAEAIARDAMNAVSRKVAPVTDTVASKTGGGSESSSSSSSDDDREQGRREREQRRAKRRKTLEQAGSS